MIMKKLYIVFGLAFVLFALVGCNNQNDKDIQYSVEFIYDNDLTTVVVKVNEGEKVTKPDDPIKDGFNFVYWMDAETLNRFNFETTITTNLILKPKFEAKTIFIVTFDRTKFSSQEIAKGDYAKSPGIPKMLNYTFLGWVENLDSNNFFDFNTPINRHYVLLPKWEEQTDTGLLYSMISTDAGDYYYVSLRDNGPENVDLPTSYEGHYINELISSSGGSGIVNITLHQYIHTIDPRFFAYAIDLESISIDSRNVNYYSEDGILYFNYYDGLQLVFFPINKEVQNYSIKNNVSLINSYSFMQNKNIETLNLTTGKLDVIRGFAFSYANIKNIVIPDDVDINYQAFNNYTNGNIFLMTNTYNFNVEQSVNVYTVDQWELINGIPVVKIS